MKKSIIAFFMFFLMMLAGIAFAEFGFVKQNDTGTCIVSVINPHNNLYYLADNFIQLDINGVDEMIAQYGNEHSVSYEVLEGEQVLLDLWETLDQGISRHYLECCVLNKEELHSGSSSLVRITLTWGGTSVSTELQINYISAEIPSINWPDSVAMTAGQDCVVYTQLSSYDFPFNVKYIGYSTKTSSTLKKVDNSHYHDANNNLWTKIRIDEPGRYLGEASFRTCNLFVSKNMVFDVSPAGTPLFIHDGNNYVKRVAFRDNPSLGISHMSYGGMYNVDSSLAYSGAPEWSVEWVGDNHGVTFTTGYYENNLWLWDENNSRRALGIWFNNEPTEPCVLSYKVTCSWGGGTYSSITSLDYQALDLTGISGLGIWDELTNMVVNEQFYTTITIPDVLNDFNHLQDKHVDLSVKNANVWSNYNGTSLILTPQETGVFYTTVEAIIENVCLTQNVYMIVRDQHSSVDEPEILFRYHGGKPFLSDSLDLAVIPEDNTGIWNDSFLFSIHIQNDNTLKNTYGGNPTWTVSVPDDFLYLTFQEDEHPGIAFVHMGKHTPQTACTVRADFILNWGTLSYTIPFTINFVEDVLPSGFKIPSTIKMKVGETKTERCGFTPDRYAFSENYRVDVKLDDGTSFDDLFTISDYDRYRFKITPKTSATGSWSGNMKVYDANMVAENRSVIFIVEDDNITVPTLAFKDEFMQVESMPAFEDNPEIGLSHDGWLGNVRLENFNALKNVKTGNPQWSIELSGHTKGAHAYFTEWDDHSGIDIHVENEPTEPTVFTVKVFCTWGEETVETRKYYSYEVPDSLPLGLDIPDTITGLQVNTATDIVINAIDNYEYGGFNYVGIHSAHFSYDQQRNGSTLTITPHEAGVFTATLYKRLHGMRLDKQVVLKIMDENGNIPEVTPLFGLDGPVFETNVYVGPADSETAEGWMCASTIFGWWLDNIPVLKSIYGDNPTVQWSYERTGGDLEVPLTLVPLKHEFVTGDECEVQVAQMPNASGTMEFNLYCDWNGHIGTLPCKFNFIKPTSAPETNTFPETILMKVGETRDLSESYSGGTFSEVAANWAWLYADEEYLDVRRTSNNRFTMNVTALKRGVTTARGDVGVGNGFVQKLVNVVIADKVLILPASLKVIEEEAFSEIKNAAFYVPSSVTSIASNAFDSTAVIICDKGSKAETICKGYGLIVVTE